MSKHFFKWLFIIAILGLLNACGGGGDEPSGLLDDTGGNTGDTSSPADTSADEFTDIAISLGAQQIIPSGGSTTVLMTTYIADADREGEIAPNVDLNITVHPSGSATLHNVPKRTNQVGDASFTVSHPSSGNVTVNISGAGRFKKGFDIPLYFGASAAAEVISKNTVQADGQTPIAVKVLVRDWAGTGIANIPVDFSFPIHSFAVPTALGNTDQNGEFTTGITNTVAQSTKVTPIAGGMQTGSLTLNFSASQVVTVPVRLDMIVSSDNVLANGQAAATLVVIARDTTGTPVPNIPINIASDSASAQLKIGAESKTLFINGNTGNEGSIELNITNTVEETVSITATVTSGTETQEQTQEIQFTNSQSTSGIDIGSIELDQPVLSPSEPKANGTDTVTLVGKIIDKDGNPVANQPVSIIKSGGLASIQIANNGKTNQAGIFIATFTDSVVEQFTARVVVGNISSEPVSISFVAKSQDEQPTETFPSQIIILATPQQQLIAEGGTGDISLTVVVRDKDNTPVSGAQVIMTASSSTAQFDNTIAETSSNGTASFNISESVAGNLTVTATVEGQSGQIRQSKVLSFVSETGATVAASSKVRFLDVNVFNNNQPADGNATIQIDAVARDANGVAVPEVPILVQMSAGSTAVANPSIQNTDDNGFFQTQISSTKAGDVAVSIAVEGSAIVSQPQVITFTAQTGPDVPPATVTLEALNNRQPADGESKITLVATPKNASGTPIAGVDITFIDESDSVEITGGITNALGEYRVPVTSQVAETFNVTPVAKGSVIGSPVSLVFVPVDSGTIDFQVLNDNQPADDQAAITLVVTFRDVGGNPIKDAEVQFVDDSEAVEITGGLTNALGEFRTIVKSTVAKTIKVTPVVKDIVGEQKTITFVPLGSTVTDLVVNVVKNHQPATGSDEDAIEIEVIARSSGRTVKGAAISVQLPGNSAAVAKPSQGVTDENGVFPTKITSTVPGDVTVTIVADNSAVTQQSKVITFISGSALSTTTNVGLQLLGATPQLADGQSEQILVVTPRDANNAPVAEVDIELISDSTTAIIEPSEGQTNALGEFRTKITNTVAETFTVTAIAGGIKGDPFPVTFNPIGENVELQVTVVDNNQAANGSPTQINVVAREGGKAVEGVPIVVLIDSGAAVANPSQGNTDANGTFSTEITSSEAGLVHVTIRDESTGVAAQPKQLSFLAESGITPTTVELIAKNAPQPADGTSKITLVVIPRDGRGIPAVGVEIELISESDLIKIEPTSGTSNVLGEFRASVVTASDMSDTLTNTLKVNITPVAAGNIIGASTPVIFTPVAVPIPATLSMTVTNNNVEAGQDATLTVLARDDNGSPMGNVPVKLSVAPGDEPPDITGSAIFGTAGFEGLTAENTGVFETSLKNNQPGTVKVTASALGKDGTPLLNSNTVDVVFKAAPGDDVKEVTNIRLITSNPQLDSEGNSDGVLITAIVKNKANNLVEGAVVNFSATSGEIQPLTAEGSSLAGMTNESGQALARLTTVGNADNRTITVKATVPTTSGEIREATVDIEVAGTAILVSGQQTVILGSTINIGISLKDSAGKGVGGQSLTVTSSLGNTLDNSSPQTNASGQANVQLTANVAGEDTITVSKPGVTSSELQISISDDNFTLSSFPDSGVAEINLDTPQEFLVHWDKGINSPQANQSINVSSTRGTLSANNILTDTNGDARFTISANNSGQAVITVSVSGGGPSAQILVDFIATQAHLMTLQADPVTISVNTLGSEAQQSEITAVVRDPENNLVKGKLIDFSLTDVTGGRLFPSSATTDSFGRASTVYFAGISPSAADGVKVTATVVDTPSVKAFVELTVAAKSLFVTLGTGNKIEEDGSTRYKYPYNVLVNDANGVAITDTEVILSVLPTRFYKGWWYPYPKEDPERWEPNPTYGCTNEDNLPSSPEGDRLNGILNAGEDLNNSGKLEPGNVATFDSGGTVKTVETDANGFADFYIVYAKEYAFWVDVRLSATASVAGSEGLDQKEFRLVGLASDYTDVNVSPPGNPSPFGIGDQVVYTEDKNGNGRLDPDEDGLIALNGLLDTEDQNNNGILDPGEDGIITELPGRICSPDSIGTNGKPLSDSDGGVAGAPNCNPNPGELDTEDLNGNQRLDLTEDINGNGSLDIEYANTCDSTD